MRTLLPALACVLAIACSDASDPAGTALPESDTASASSQSVSLELTTSVVESGRMRLVGTTDLPDGALLGYLVEHDGFASGDFDGQLQGLMSVAGGAFDADLDLEGWPTGHAFVWVSFGMNPSGDAEQPASLVETYGKRGEQLVGPNVVGSGDSKKIELKVDVAIP